MSIPSTFSLLFGVAKFVGKPPGQDRAVSESPMRTAAASPTSMTHISHPPVTRDLGALPFPHPSTHLAVGLLVLSDQAERLDVIASKVAMQRKPVASAQSLGRRCAEGEEEGRCVVEPLRLGRPF